MRSTVRQVMVGLSFVLIAVFIGTVLYFNALYNLMDTTEITGNPTIAESDLADQADLLPIETTEQSSSSTASSTAESKPQQMTNQTTESSVQETTETMIPSETTTAIPSISPESTPSETTPSETTTETAAPTLSIQTLYPILFSDNVYNIMLIGTDTRSDGFNGRSDAMMILSVNRRTRKIHLVSLMRGLYVAIADHDRSMLNNAYSWGGAKLLLQTVQENFRIRVDDYIVINFSGFKQAIDIIGGVEITLTQDEVNYMLLAFPEGKFQTGSNLLNGDQALCYARIRQIDSDYRRTARQRMVIESLINKLEKSSAGQMDALVRQLLPLVKTNLSRTRMISLAVNVLQYKSYPIKQLMLPITGTYQTIIVRGIQMTQYDEVKNIEALQAFLYQN